MMVSSTQQSSRIRRRKQTTNGKANKRIRRRLTTPAFPVHPEGYDASAADALPSASSEKKLERTMANHPSSEKRNRQRVKRTQRNRAIKSAVRTQVKSVRATIGAGKKDEATTGLKEAASSVDRAASKGAIHKKAASRTKARLARALHKLSAAAAPSKAAS
jgi:small subunit ribosomal protein S20